MCVCVEMAFRKVGFKLRELQFVIGHSIFLPCNILSPSVKEREFVCSR